MPITSFPPAPSRADPATFADRADAYLGHLENPFVAEANALEANVNAKEASTNALSLAAVNAVNISAWVSGTTYAIGVTVYDPVDLLSYRRSTAGAGTTRPGLDNANWVVLNGLGNVRLDTNQTFTGINTFSQPIVGSVTGNAGTAGRANSAVTVDFGVYTFGAQDIFDIKYFKGGVLSGSATQPTGYMTGAGGTVTQLTSKSTAVSINKPTGVITTHNASLAAGASVVFQVNNNLVINSYLVVAHCGSDTPESKYTVSVLSVSPIAFTLRLTNITGGNLAEAVKINYAVFCGVTL